MEDYTKHNFRQRAIGYFCIGLNCCVVLQTLHQLLITHEMLNYSSFLYLSLLNLSKRFCLVRTLNSHYVCNIAFDKLLDTFQIYEKQVSCDLPCRQIIHRWCPVCTYWSMSVRTTLSDVWAIVYWLLSILSECILFI